MAADTIEQTVEGTEGFDESLNTGDRISFTTSAVEALRQQPELLDQGWYTEILEDEEGNPIIVPAPPGLRQQMASIGNNHSVLDELRSLGADNTSRYLAFADAHQLRTEKVRGKGILQRDVTGKVVLIIGENRNLSLKAISQLLIEAPHMGIDGGIEQDLKYQKGEPITFEFGDSEPYYIGHIGYETISGVEPYSAEFRSAVATNISITHDKTMKDGKIIDTFEAQVRGKDACTPLHKPIYEKLGIEDPRGLVDVEFEGKHYQIGIRHTIDHQANRVAVNIFFGGDYGKPGQLLEKVIVEHYRSYLYGYGEMPIEVTVSDSQAHAARKYAVEHI